MDRTAQAAHTHHSQRLVALQDWAGRRVERNEDEVSSQVNEEDSQGDDTDDSDIGHETLGGEKDEDDNSDREEQSETPDRPSSPKVFSTTKSEQAEDSQAEYSQAEYIQAERPFEDEHCLQELQFYKHITISRDHTAASVDYWSDLLVAFGSRQEKDEYIAAPVDSAPAHFSLDFDPSAFNIANPTQVNLDLFGAGSILVDSTLMSRGHSMQLANFKQQSKRNTLMARRGNQTQDLNTSSTDYGLNKERGKRNMQEATAPSVKEIQQEIQKLQDLQRKLFSTKYEVFHKIKGNDTTFLAEPSWTSGSRGFQFQGNSPIADEPTFLKQRPEIAFVVYKYYSSEHQAEEVQDSKSAGTALPKPAPYEETIAILSEPLATALDMFLNKQESFKTDFPAWKSTAPIASPFLFWYYYRSSPVLDSMEEPHQSQMKLLANWIEENYSKAYAGAETLFAKGLVSRPTMPFFVKPGEVVVSKRNQVIQGHVVASWSWSLASLRWKASTWLYGFDGSFYEVWEDLYVNPSFDNNHHTAEIAQLEILPLRLTSSEFHTKLERRGRMFWDCRYRNLVAYENGDASDVFGRGERYMVDLKTYKQLHPEPAKSKHIDPHSRAADRRDMSSTVMEAAEPPEGPGRLVFPSAITGYNLRRKTWQDLEVDRIHSVSWNKEAFEHLVIDQDAKDLIEALIRTKLETDQGTDLIRGKGNGLVMLLHGGPGTGKTFTAESVAEFAEKPLFRVTCGDIGTEPEKVEKYLESVLHLGKTWGCIVLLDEADVFLEQRTLTDLQRNALVSVFLRILEYYEGILILTSNRVGTFDEAFKSRIQLSLHYEPLNRTQRHKIWKNFFHRLRQLESAASIQRKGKAPAGGTLADRALKPLGEYRKRKWPADDSTGDDSVGERSAGDYNAGIDFDDIDCFLSELAEMEMNGRQIRNAITTARQLARFKNMKMSSVHLKNVIKVSKKFDDYLEKVRDGHTDDQIAREDGLR
ncbi:hypothetical protein RB595_000290 [Gaeumannomyces hyphopodioides]